MLSFDECKAIAEEKAKEYGAEITAAYKIGNDFAFDTAEKWVGVFPFTVDSETGEICGLWEYLCRTGKTMDDMQETAV